MAPVICAVCTHGNPADRENCDVCGNSLAVVRPKEPKEPKVDDAAPRCPKCAALIPDPANRVCVECLEPLTSTTPAPAGVRLLFAGHAIDVPAPGSVLLGRDPTQSSVAGHFAANDNVSRRHASVGAEPDGSAWVRDEYSANGTFVNDNRVPGGKKTPLVDGDRLRMASDVVATIELGGSR